ncbi:hypothetical protein L7F22_049175 [Adiantum nelumboides]|nr:hypothetical protein [Adiantum nelumboides]
MEDYIRKRTDSSVRRTLCCTASYNMTDLHYNYNMADTPSAASSISATCEAKDECSSISYIKRGSSSVCSSTTMQSYHEYRGGGKSSSAGISSEVEQAVISHHEVRVVQIFNPVLVKTDVANFRSLVQRLTGQSGCSLTYWNKLRRLSAAAKLHHHQVIDMDAAASGASAAAATTNNFVEGVEAEDDDDEEQPRRHCQYAAAAAVAAAESNMSAFNELDIHAALLSDGPLPDITMLPPLITSAGHHFPPPSASHSLCT